MSVICPKCGKENTVPFSDIKLNQHGFECQDCHKDFGVDDGKTLKEWEDSLVDFFYERVYKDKSKKRISNRKTEAKNEDYIFDSFYSLIKFCYYALQVSYAVL